MTIYYLPHKIVGNQEPQPTGWCSTCPPSWLPGLLAVSGAFVGSVIGGLGRPSISRQGMGTLLGGVIGLSLAYWFPPMSSLPWPLALLGETK